MYALDIDKEYFGDTYIFEDEKPILTTSKEIVESMEKIEELTEKERPTLVIDKTVRESWKINYSTFSDISEVSKELGAIRYKLIQMAEEGRSKISKYDKDDETFLHKLEFLDELSEEEAIKMIKEEKKSREERRVIKNRNYVIQLLLSSLKIKNPNAVVVKLINSKGDITKKAEELKADKTLFV